MNLNNRSPNRTLASFLQSLSWLTWPCVVELAMERTSTFVASSIQLSTLICVNQWLAMNFIVRTEFFRDGKAKILKSSANICLVTGASEWSPSFLSFFSYAATADKRSLRSQTIKSSYSRANHRFITSHDNETLSVCTRKCSTQLVSVTHFTTSRLLRSCDVFLRLFCFTARLTA